MAEWSKAVDSNSIGQLSAWFKSHSVHSMIIEDLVWPVFPWPQSRSICVSDKASIPTR